MAMLNNQRVLIMVIFHSCVELPEGNGDVMGISWNLKFLITIIHEIRHHNHTITIIIYYHPLNSLINYLT